jgi:hypothetical protein
MITEKRELKNVPLADLIPYARNPRKNDPAVQRVAASLKEYGLVKNSIVVDEDMVLITGHTTTEGDAGAQVGDGPGSDAGIRTHGSAEESIPHRRQQTRRTRRMGR